jgi:hypothetical protein
LALPDSVAASLPDEEEGDADLLDELDKELLRASQQEYLCVAIPYGATTTDHN